MCTEPHFTCEWHNCSYSFTDAFTLQKHVFSSHISSTGAEEEYYCQWSSCAGYSSNKDTFLSHLQTHVYIPETRCPSPELSSSPSTPSSSSSLESIESVDCNQDVQGIALAACFLLDCISQDPEGAGYLKPFEKELHSIAESRPRLAGKIWSICSHFSWNFFSCRYYEHINICTPSPLFSLIWNKTRKGIKGKILFIKHQTTGLVIVLTFLSVVSCCKETHFLLILVLYWSK